MQNPALHRTNRSRSHAPPWKGLPGFQVRRVSAPDFASSDQASRDRAACAENRPSVKRFQFRALRIRALYLLCALPIAQRKRPPARRVELDLELKRRPFSHLASSPTIARGTMVLALQVTTTRLSSPCAWYSHGRFSGPRTRLIEHDAPTSPDTNYVRHPELRVTHNDTTPFLPERLTEE